MWLRSDLRRQALALMTPPPEHLQHPSSPACLHNLALLGMIQAVPATWRLRLPAAAWGCAAVAALLEQGRHRQGLFAPRTLATPLPDARSSCLASCRPPQLLVAGWRAAGHGRPHHRVSHVCSAASTEYRALPAAHSRPLLPLLLLLLLVVPLSLVPGVH
jgi:hypothetical protein